MILARRSLRFRRSLPLVVSMFAGVILLPGSRGFAQTWREVQSPHFRVVTDGSDKDGRDVAKEFEQMRSVFADRFPKATLETGAPLTIVAVREQGLHALAPSLWKDRDRVAGEFFHGWEKQFAMVRLDSFGDLNQVVIFHEYTHSIFHANLHWLPTWLDEGMAEFYAYTRFQGDHVYIGAPSVRLGHLKNDSLISIPEMLAANGRTYAKDDRRNDIFYGESWAMVHYMNFGPDMDHGAKLNQFIALLESGKPQPEAFKEVFGDSKAFQEKLSIYLSKFALIAGLLPPMQGMDAKSFPAKVLTAAQVNYELGTFDVGVHDAGEGKKRLLAAESADSSLAGPHEELGFLAWRKGEDDEAKAEWQKAVAADSTSSYRSTFALLMSGMSVKKMNQKQLEDTLQALTALKEIAPRYAPVYAEIALVQWRLGHSNAAYQTALAAEKLEPWRAGYHLLTGHILLQGRQAKMAGSYARLVAARWPGSDHDEAVDLWNEVGPAERGDGPDLKLDTPADATLVRGTIVNTFCDKSGLNVVLQPAMENASPLKLVAAGPFESGFSDTLWFGEDHYTPCFHLAGLPAVVAYKTIEGGVQRLMEFQVRDNLPDLQSTTSVPKTAADTTSEPTHP